VFLDRLRRPRLFFGIDQVGQECFWIDQLGQGCFFVVDKFGRTGKIGSYIDNSGQIWF